MAFPHYQQLDAMNPKFLLFLLFIFHFYDVNSNINPEKITFEKKYLIKDFHFFHQLIKKKHPLYYKTKFNDSIDYYFLNGYKEIKNQMSFLDFHRLLQRKLAVFKDPHTSLLSLNVLSNYNEYLDSITAFPYEIKIINNKLYIKKCLDKSNLLLENDEIIQINNFNVKTIIDTIYQYSVFKNIQSFYVSLENNHSQNFSYLLWYALNFKSPYDVKYKRNGKILNVNIETKYSIYNNICEIREKYIINKKYNCWDFSIIDKIGIIKVKSFTDELTIDSLINEFLDDSFLKLKKDKIEKLVIDIRTNTGGSDVLVYKLLNYISKDTISLNYPIKVRSSTYRKLLNDFIVKNNKYYFYLFYPFIVMSGLYSNEKLHLIQPNAFVFEPSKTPKFDGKIVLLTSADNFSSSDLFVKLFKLGKLGKVVGAKTATINDFESAPPAIYQLPATKTTFSFSIGAIDYTKLPKEINIPDKELNNQEVENLKFNDLELLFE